MSYTDDHNLDWIDWEEVQDEYNRHRYVLMVSQDVWWHPQGQINEIMVNDMDVTHVHNLIYWLDRNFNRYQDRYCLFGPIPLEEAPLYIRLKERLQEFMGDFSIEGL